MSVECWRPIPSLPDVIASTHGRLMRIPWVADMPRGGTRTYGGCPTQGAWDGARYLYPYKGTTYKVARLICEAFHGAVPFERAVVMHLNEDASDNRPVNLRWGTQKENLNASGFLAYCRSRTGESNPRIKGLSQTRSNA